jgi:hypothetical protein
MSCRAYVRGASHTTRAVAFSGRLPTRPFGVREEPPQDLDLEARMRTAERFGHRLGEALSGGGAPETREGSPVQGAAPVGLPVIQRLKDQSTVERLRRTNARSVKRVTGDIKKQKNKFAKQAWGYLKGFENDKSKTSMSTPFGPVNLSNFGTNDPGAKITTVAKDYGKKSVGHKYSDLVDALGPNGPKVASELLTGISSNKGSSTAITSDLQKNAAAKMLSISHISEERRFGGSGKMFRAVLRMVKDKKVTMKDAFTGPNPLFPMAKSPKQMRRLINVEKAKQRKPPPKPARFDEVGGNMSDSSDDEN